MKLVGISGEAGSGKDTAADHLVKKYGFVKISLADPLKRICQEIYGFTDEQLWGPSSARNKPDTRYIRAVHARHDWQEATPGADFKCTQCGCWGEESPPECTVYLTPRFALQILGTEFGRTCYPNTWIDKSIQIAQQLLANPEYMRYSAKRGLFTDDAPKKKEEPKGVAISDVRFRNELTGVRGVEGQLWRVKPPATHTRNNETWRGHLSETEQNEIADSEFNRIIVNNKVAFEVLYADVDAALAVSFPS